MIQRVVWDLDDSTSDMARAYTKRPPDKHGALALHLGL